MKHSLYVISFLVLLMACTPSVPSDVIQPDVMEKMLYDYHVAQAMARDNRGDESEDFVRARYLAAVLNKYGVSEAEFDSSLVYYYSRVDYLKDIYAHVNERLAGEAKALGASVGDIGRYSAYGASGDTANIWTNATDVLLMPLPTMNRYDFTIKADTSFHKGDSFMFQFLSEYIWQSGMKDVTVCIVSKYDGDSILQTVNHVSSPGLSQVRIPANRESALREMTGFIYLSGNNDDARLRRMMFISQMQLIRFHNKITEPENNDTLQADTLKTDSVQRTDDARRALPDTLRGRVIGRRVGGTPLSPGRGAAEHRVEAGPAGIKVRR